MLIYVVLIEEITSCGCNEADVDTIGILDTDNGKVQLCPDGCWTPIEDDQYRELTQREVEKAKPLFEKATKYNYAIFE